MAINKVIKLVLVFTFEYVVDTATGYGLDGPGIGSRYGGEIFRTGPDRTWGPPSLL